LGGEDLFRLKMVKSILERKQKAAGKKEHRTLLHDSR
jgi:hypothetical protein